MVFAGVGLVAFPVDCIKAFVGRPRTTISRSEFVKRAQGLGNRAKQIKVQPLVTLSHFLSLQTDKRNTVDSRYKRLQYKQFCVTSKGFSGPICTLLISYPSDRSDHSI